MKRWWMSTGAASVQKQPPAPLSPGIPPPRPPRTKGQYRSDVPGERQNPYSASRRWGVHVPAINVRSFKRQLHPATTEKPHPPADSSSSRQAQRGGGASHWSHHRAKMAEQVAKLLKDYLEEMNDSRLSEFKWYLSQHKQNGCRPLQRSQLESGTRTDTVDQLVQTFGEDGALVVAVDILYRMGLNHLATKLAQGKIDREAEEHPAEEERLPAQKLKAPKDLFCSVCLCIFQTPVMLQCGHSFCRSCVLQTWAGKLSRKCPLCEQVSAEGPPQVNFSLKSLSESFLETHAEPAAARRDDSPREVRTKQEEFQKVMSICSSAVERLERQSRATEMKIREEFEKLGRCLKTEEANRLAALKQEEAQRIRLIQMIMEASRDTFSLSDTVKNMEELVTGGSFITNFKSSLESTQKVLLAPELIQVQIDEAKYVDNLQLRVLKKMLRIIKNIPEASPRLLPPDAQPEVTVKVTCKYPGQASRHPQVLVHRRGPGPADGEAEQERAPLQTGP